MYILTGILVSLIYTSQISCAASSSHAPVISHKIHTIFNKNTGCNLTELLQDRNACTEGRFYLDRLSEFEPYQSLRNAIQQERNKEKRKKMWHQLDWHAYTFFTAIQQHLLTNIESAALRTSMINSVYIAHVLFQREWQVADPATFDSAFHHLIAGSKSSKRAGHRSSSTAHVPRSSSNRYIHQRGR